MILSLSREDNDIFPNGLHFNHKILLLFTIITREFVFGGRYTRTQRRIWHNIPLPVYRVVILDISVLINK